MPTWTPTFACIITKFQTRNLWKQGLITGTAVIKTLALQQIVVKRNAQLLNVPSLDINKNVTLAHMKQYLKIASGNIKSLSTTLNIQMIQDYQRDFGKSRIAMENQKICLSYRPNSKRYLLYLKEKYKILTYKENNLLNKRTEKLKNVIRYHYNASF